MKNNCPLYCLQSKKQLKKLLNIPSNKYIKNKFQDEINIYIDKKDKPRLIEAPNKELKEISVDITEISDKETLIEQLNNLQLEENCLYKIILIGKRKFEINIYDLYKMNLNTNIVKIKDNTKPDINVEALSKENNLKGLFVKEILQEIEKGEIDKSTLENVLEIGLDILEK